MLTFYLQEIMNEIYSKQILVDDVSVYFQIKKYHSFIDTFQYKYKPVTQTAMFS